MTMTNKVKLLIEDRNKIFNLIICYCYKQIMTQIPGLQDLFINKSIMCSTAQEQ